MKKVTIGEFKKLPRKIKVDIIGDVLCVVFLTTGAVASNSKLATVFLVIALGVFSLLKILDFVVMGLIAKDYTIKIVELKVENEQLCKKLDRISKSGLN